MVTSRNSKHKNRNKKGGNDPTRSQKTRSQKTRSQKVASMKARREKHKVEAEAEAALHIKAVDDAFKPIMNYSANERREKIEKEAADKRMASIVRHLEPFKPASGKYGFSSPAKKMSRAKQTRLQRLKAIFRRRKSVKPKKIKLPRGKTGQVISMKNASSSAEPSSYSFDPTYNSQWSSWSKEFQKSPPDRSDVFNYSNPSPQ